MSSCQCSGAPPYSLHRVCHLSGRKNNVFPSYRTTSGSDGGHSGYALPVLNGIEATHQIRARVPGAEVLIFTMHDTATLVREVLGATIERRGPRTRGRAC
jgi:DNA-binding NarL/FixJ family response regulator